jgi:hypothetical protein
MSRIAEENREREYGENRMHGHETQNLLQATDRSIQAMISNDMLSDVVATAWVHPNRNRFSCFFILKKTRSNPKASTSRGNTIHRNPQASFSVARHLPNPTCAR